MNSKLSAIIDLLDNITNYAYSAFFIVTLAICIYVIIDSVSIIEQGERIEDAKSYISKNNESSNDGEEHGDSRVADLKKINSDVVAWITVDDAVIDYPVVHTNNNQYYLNHDFKKDYSVAGSIFADYRNDLLKDDYSVIYGHNMSGKKMFGHLHMFDDKSFFDSHKTGKIYFEKESHDLDIIAYGIVDNGVAPVYEIEKYRNNTEEFLSYFKRIAKYMRDKKAKKYILLSTCYSDRTKRVVLLVGYND